MAREIKVPSVGEVKEALADLERLLFECARKIIGYVIHYAMKHSEFTLSLAKIGDAAVIANMSRQLIEFDLPWRWTEQRVAASIRAPHTNVVVARIDGGVIGFAIMKYGERVAHLNLFAVAPDYRRARVGRQLLQWLEKCATVAGQVAISLEVRATNTGAQRFYQSMGYQILVRLPGYYQGNEAALRMGRRLTARPLKN